MTPKLVNELEKTPNNQVAVQKVRNQLREELGREPTAQDVATHLDEPLEDILEAFLARDAYEPESLDAPVRDDAPGATTAHVLIQREIGERISCSQMHCRASWDTLQRMEASAASGFAR